ncbi:hypothetical protein L873DRAFT_1795989 [Choiromyces venosus 120613-1]|uniref:Uncharacterized protein n=1 Tax=Choiromyces venosus 120613-1 TaxID=1336337 RepID=A0A3N4IZH7_9PEZI|nr:hypothetical protein L873DRAFT_1795989 [Choiromyces venosus 120613-1]
MPAVPTPSVTPTGNISATEHYICTDSYDAVLAFQCPDRSMRYTTVPCAPSRIYGLHDDDDTCLTEAVSTTTIILLTVLLICAVFVGLGFGIYKMRHHYNRRFWLSLGSDGQNGAIKREDGEELRPIRTVGDDGSANRAAFSSPVKVCDSKMKDAVQKDDGEDLKRVSDNGFANHAALRFPAKVFDPKMQAPAGPSSLSSPFSPPPKNDQGLVRVSVQYIGDYPDDTIKIDDDKRVDRSGSN